MDAFAGGSLSASGFTSLSASPAVGKTGRRGKVLPLPTIPALSIGLDDSALPTPIPAKDPAGRLTLLAHKQRGQSLAAKSSTFDDDVLDVLALPELTAIGA